MEQLEALGYLDFSEEQASEADGVVIFDQSRSFPGLNLYAIPFDSAAEVIDARGNVVRRWQVEGSGTWLFVELMPDGGLLAITRGIMDYSKERKKELAIGEGAASRGLLRLDRDGRILWKRQIPAHHDVEVLPDGRLVTLTLRYRKIPELHPSAVIEDNGIALLSAEGQLLEEFSLYDALKTAPAIFTLEARRPSARRDGQVIELFHSNSIARIDHPHLVGRHPLYDVENLIVSVRNQDTVVILEPKRERLVWAWGRGEISRQHSASVLANGNVLLFDNGLKEKRSRILEVDPLTGKIAWQYQTPNPGDFFSWSRGSAQRLPNGNTLVANSTAGEAFETTSAGEIVWKYAVPYVSEGRRRSVLPRILRFDPALFAARAGADRTRPVTGR